jgi:hypothetical protein
MCLVDQVLVVEVGRWEGSPCFVVVKELPLTEPLSPVRVPREPADEGAGCREGRDARCALRRQAPALPRGAAAEPSYGASSSPPAPTL